jgi:WD40 repeat protein
LASGQIVYPAAAMGIVHDTAKNEQTFLKCGVDDIISLVVDPEGIRVYLGEQAERPAIYVWDTSSSPYTLVTTIRKCLKTGVDGLEINNNGFLLASCLDKNNTLAIYSREENYDCIYTVKLGNDEMCTFDPTAEYSTPTFTLHGSIIQLNWISDYKFVLTGNGEPQLRSVSSEDTEMVTFPLTVKSSAIILCAVDCPNGDVAFGTTDGDLLIWKHMDSSDQRSNQERLHKGSLDALAVDSAGSGHFTLMSGGKDGIIHVFNEVYNKIMHIEIYSLCPHIINGQIRAISLCLGQKKIGVGCISGDIFEINYE